MALKVNKYKVIKTTLTRTNSFITQKYERAGAFTEARIVRTQGAFEMSRVFLNIER